jgi:hypothetical protein
MAVLIEVLRSGTSVLEAGEHTAGALFGLALKDNCVAMGVLALAVVQASRCKASSSGSLCWVCSRSSPGGRPRARARCAGCARARRQVEGLEVGPDHSLPALAWGCRRRARVILPWWWTYHATQVLDVMSVTSSDGKSNTYSLR